MEKISWTDSVRNEEVLHRVKEEERNILRAIKRWKANWIGHLLELPSETRYRRKERGKDRNDGKTRKKT
jgi:hypothetical protein